MISLFSSQKRQRESFEREALPHLEALHAYALHLCRDSADADDLVQETYIKALSNFASYQAGTNCRAWLFRILTNTFFNMRRSRKRHNPIDSESRSSSCRWRKARRIAGSTGRSTCSCSTASCPST
jgi:RNA polymerase sigma factor (sigma-70 family)